MAIAAHADEIPTTKAADLALSESTLTTFVVLESCANTGVLTHINEHTIAITNNNFFIF